jgi:PAS domain S-box-containing protein
MTLPGTTLVPTATAPSGESTRVPNLFLSGVVTPDEDAIFRGIHRRGDRWMGYFIGVHLLFAAALAPLHDTWIAAAALGGTAAALFYLCAWLRPGEFVTRAVAGLSLQAFVVLHIHQMAGLAEMHFFFFTAVTAMIIYMDWRAPWPGVIAIIVQHTIFHHWHNQGIRPGGLPFFEPETVGALRMSFHYGIAIAQVAIASYWAHVLRQRTLRDAFRRVELERANTLLQEQQVELERTNDELRESEQRFRSTFDQAAVGVAHVGLDGRWLRVNERLCHIVGRTGDELLRLRFQDITHPDDLDLDLDHVRSIVEGRLPQYSIEKRYLRPDGSPVWINLTVSLVRGADGAPLYFISVIEDVDARKRTEAERDALHAREAEARREAEAANRAKMEFLSAMSHELRTPLNAITGYVDLINLGIHGPVTDAQTRALNRVRQSGEHLLGLINDILTYAKIEAGRIDFEVREVPLSEVIEETVAMIEPHLPAAGLHCGTEGLDPALRALGDPERIRQIVLNLLTNAVKFTPSGGRIRIACVRKEGWVSVGVSDTGIGIPAEMVQKIFDPFVQVRNAQDRDSSRQGIGLGLAISRDLAHAMGGELDVRSTPGQGSTFTLRLREAGERVGA